MNGIVVNPEEYGMTRNELMIKLRENGIDSRLFFTGMHRQPSLQKYGCDCEGKYPVSDWLAENGLYLPSGSLLNELQIKKISKYITEIGK
jgi:perosamine synthetase